MNTRRNSAKSPRKSATTTSPATPTKVEVELADLIQPSQNQIRSRFSTKTARRYADAMLAGADFPPITVVKLDGAPVLVDGFHRVAAAKSIGMTVLAGVIVEGDRNELRWLAADANMRHGLPLSRADAREVFRAYVRARKCYRPDGGVKSSREIADDLHRIRTHATILDWMKKDFRRIWVKMVRDEEPRHDGGEQELVDADEQTSAAVIDHLTKAKALMRAVKDPNTRGMMIEAAEALVSEMRTLGDWNPPEF